MEKKRAKISSFTIIVAFVSIALAGLAFIPLLPVKLTPSRTLPAMTVSFNMPGNSSRVIEMTVTSQLESMLARIKGIKNISSTSSNGHGYISLEFDKHTDIDAARFEASTIVRQTYPNLPEGVSYPILQMRRPDGNNTAPFLTYTINAAATPIIIQRYAEENIKPRLSGIPGVEQIDVSGATPMEWRLEYDNQQLVQLGVSVENIQNAISEYYRKEFLGIGMNESNSGTEEWIRLVLAPGITDKDGFNPSLISLTTNTGKTISLDQLIKVTHQEQEPQSYFRINGLNSIYLTIRAEETANQLDLAKKLKKEINIIQENLPVGYEIHKSYDATEHIQKELNKIYFRTGLTILILLLFVLLITRNIKHLILITISLSVNLSIAVILYYLLKLEIQLYSLAGITISLSLIIDNTIVMTDHIRNRQNKGAFLSILAATLTTVGALSIIFFMDENIRLDLQDFAAVVIINLTVSLLIALFFVPALIDKMNIFKKRQKKDKKKEGKFNGINRFIRRFPVYFSHYYQKQIQFLIRKRVLACLFIVLLFGIPVFMIPEKIEENQAKMQTYSPIKQSLIKGYNKFMSNTTYKEKIKPIINKGLGGTIRLFIEKVYEGSYFKRDDSVVLSITASMPNGTTLDQMNFLVKKMESYLSTFKEIRQFHTNIQNPRRASIQVYFKKEHEHSGFPYTLKSKVISKAFTLGGGSWGVYGLLDQGFSNDVREHAGNYRIQMAGYNYDELYKQAEELKSRLMSNRRIKEVIINTEYSWYKDDYQEFTFNLNKQRMAEENIMPYQLFTSISPVFRRNMPINNIVYQNEIERLTLNSKQSYDFDIWNMLYMPQSINEKSYKLIELATIEKGQMPQNVKKVNQEYVLCIQYEYIGAGTQGHRNQERVLKEFNEELPIGYKAESQVNYWRWGEKDYKQYLLLALIIVIIFFTTSILFNSLKQPLAVICVIPISYIGVFLTFYWFKLNFDQGGFASFVLLCGITVNASIYIINEYNQLRLSHPQASPLRLYLKAWNAKITPIFLTVVSTILGFIPFMVGMDKEAFWFPLAAGTIGGLIMSVIGIFFYLPIFTLNKQVGRKDKNRIRSK